MSVLGQAFVWAQCKLSALSQVTKVLGILSAAIGLATAFVQVYTAINDHIARRGLFASLIKVADSQLHDREYNASWNANATALGIEPKSAAALAQQTQIAMRWIENVRLSPESGANTFGNIADPIEDSLVQRSTSVRGVELADIKAHIGWARFLKSRDRTIGLRILEEFTEALSIDSGNMYAHVMKGFFIVWKGDPVEAARPDFEAALQSPVDRNLCARVILSALTSFHTDPHQLAAVEYANKIRKSGRAVDEELSGRVLWDYEDGLSDTEYLAKLARVIPPDEQIANLDWLQKDQTPGRLRGNSVLRAYFLESAGQTPEALALYKEVVEQSPESNSRAVGLARSGIRRLTQKSIESPSSTNSQR
jgi:hypothetical protein